MIRGSEAQCRVTYLIVSPAPWDLAGRTRRLKAVQTHTHWLGFVVGVSSFFNYIVYRWSPWITLKNVTKKKVENSRKATSITWIEFSVVLWLHKQLICIASLSIATLHGKYLWQPKINKAQNQKGSRSFFAYRVSMEFYCTNLGTHIFKGKN